jgi:hypothetical protein
LTPLSAKPKDSIVAKVACDGCENQIEDGRVTITTEATDAHGVDVEVTKRWVLCRECSETVFTKIGEPPPWVDDDFKTVVLPDEEPTGAQPGGYAARPR